MENQDNQDQYFAHIFALFALLEATQLVGHDLAKTFKQIKQEKKKHLNSLLRLIKDWKGKTDAGSRMNYNQKAQDMLSDVGALMMETLIVTAAVPPNQMDYFAEGVQKLQMAASNRERTEQAKKAKEAINGES
jgi:rubrerythrin